MKTETKALIDRVNQIRLDEDRSYANLATEIGIDPGALYKILNGPSEPWDRTLHKIRRYLDALPSERSAKRPRKTKSSAAA